MAFLLLALLAVPDFVNGQAQPERPNILWISVEDMSARVGAYGDTVARTPNIDRLAREGMRFSSAFTAAPVCAPNRSATITGMHQNAIGTHHMRTSHQGEGLPTPYEAVPPPFVKAFPEYLRAAGYFCTNNVKTDYQFGNPFTVWDESSRDAHWRSPNRAPDQPFFAVFNFTTTHESQSWVKPDEVLTTDPASVVVPPYYPDTPEVRRQIAKQYDNIARVDAQVGEILQQLAADGYADDTIVFFWSDHGDGLPRAKRWLYDSGLHVPLIVRWPGRIERGSVNDALVSFVDLAPTVLSLAGVTPPWHMQGQVFLGAQQDPPRPYVYAARDRFDESYDMVRAVRDERFKYIRNYYPELPYVLHIPYRNRSNIMQELLRLDALDQLDETQALWMQAQRPVEELYDTQADPYEVHNLAADPAYREVLGRLRKAMDDWMEGIDDLGAVPEAEMVARMWPGGVQPVTSPPVPLARRTNGLEEGPLTAFGEPTDVILYTATQGASIGYTTEQGEDAHWRLYSGPIRLKPGTTTLRAKAVRYGYAESPEVTASFTYTPRGSR